MNALHFGAGNIGRGFIGPLLLKSGFNLTFVDNNQAIVDAINRHQKYDITVVGNNFSYITTVKKVKAIYINDPNIYFKIAKINVITISVGVHAINSLVVFFEKLIRYKIETNDFVFLTIIACENVFRCASKLKENIKILLPGIYHKYLDKNISFVDSVVDKIVCPNDKNNSDDINLSVKVEKFSEWIVDCTQFKHDRPNIIGMIYSNHLDAFFERKLFTLNTGHAIAAYLGLLIGYKNIYQAILDPLIFNIVYGAMKESGMVLIRKYNFFTDSEHKNYILKILSRFKNIYLTDSLKRVGRNPLQKLKKDDRLISPLIDTIKYNLPNANLMKGIAAALCYIDEKDIEAKKLRNMIINKGIKYVLSKISSLDSSLLIISEISIYFNIFMKVNI
ncbi:mannitol-1-phosphate dehydrogenase [Buchnera aphidicola str. Bp (Baizongia pistaciae)]|uniref:Mannitol-1-phosphate 5-dehydrogenase n=1 Tax=Buchnera aphidicola subsp. Baizongia pistaciae (strain Bp) TaxID=224915 RepID=MTLD_BUCBP|nr:mannitol-1-phosphate 5-dehydrogenase [Buchnera aphidicola]Q89A37.1 RecName: Full=Mannitol-1-phosphate 5-dehydrogenase [Buchnera aphidicola str. Bp (Baizongia pistaciae)]AAO27219.1 mannitol-1-phosphate dehydrogenase [Buchnera aphidicola str. Bp (Baizongia pistaciae)]